MAATHDTNLLIVAAAALLALLFFVTSGVSFALTALVFSASTIARIPMFLVALLAVRGIPALLYAGSLRLGDRRPGERRGSRRRRAALGPRPLLLPVVAQEPVRGSSAGRRAYHRRRGLTW